MACSECKKKKDLKEQSEDLEKKYMKVVVWFTIVWSLLGLYGLYSLIKLL